MSLVSVLIFFAISVLIIGIALYSVLRKARRKNDSEADWMLPISPNDKNLFIG